MSILGQTLPLMMFINSKQLFDVITRATDTSEKRLTIDISAGKKSYNNSEIWNVRLVNGEENPNDDFENPIFSKDTEHQ